MRIFESGKRRACSGFSLIEILLVIAVIGLLSAFLMPTMVKAQDSNVPTNAATWFGSIGNYFTSFDTNNLIRHANGLEVSTAVDYENGLNFADEVAIKKIFGKPADASDFFTEAVFRNAGVAGVLVDAKAGVGYALFHYDTEVSASLDGGYSFQSSKPDITLSADVRKATTANTFLGTGIFYDQVIGNKAASYPGIRITAGFLY